MPSRPIRALVPLVTLLAACRAEPAPAPPAPSAGPAAPAPADVPPCAPPTVRFVAPTEGPADTTLIMLHGYGADAADIEPVALALARARPRMAVLVPDGCDPVEASPHGRQWWGIRSTPAEERGPRLRTAAIRVGRLIDAELERRGLPRDRLVWAGFSQGAMIAQWMAVHGTPRPLAAISFSGRFDDDAPPGAPVPTPVLLVHGARDPMIPFAEAARAEQALRARGALVERLDRPSMGHSIDETSRAAAVAFLGQHL